MHLLVLTNLKVMVEIVLLFTKKINPIFLVPRLEINIEIVS